MSMDSPRQYRATLTEYDGHVIEVDSKLSLLDSGKWEAQELSDFLHALADDVELDGYNYRTISIAVHNANVFPIENDYWRRLRRHLTFFPLGNEELQRDGGMRLNVELHHLPLPWLNEHSKLLTNRRVFLMNLYGAVRERPSVYATPPLWMEVQRAAAQPTGLTLELYDSVFIYGETSNSYYAIWLDDFTGGSGALRLSKGVDPDLTYERFVNAHQAKTILSRFTGFEITRTNLIALSAEVGNPNFHPLIKTNMPQ